MLRRTRTFDRGGIDIVLCNVARCKPKAAMFTVHTGLDNMGPKLIGKQLHITVRNSIWWSDKLKLHFENVYYVGFGDSKANKHNCGFICR